jgi:hypothetical protein
MMIMTADQGSEPPRLEFVPGTMRDISIARMSDLTRDVKSTLGEQQSRGARHPLDAANCIGQPIEILLGVVQGQ